MAKIKVNLKAFYGHSDSCGSNKTIEVEVSENELNALKKIDKKEIFTEDVVMALKGGNIILKTLHDKLSDAFYDMVEEYRLFKVDNEFLYENLEESMEDDIRYGLYTSEYYDDYEDEDDDYDYIDDDEEELNKYYRWVKEHDHEFIAERVGLDLESCRDEKVTYKILLSL